MDEFVLYDTADGVATITLNNPERRNAWNRVMEAQYFEALDRASADDAARVIVVTGAGKSFCPGLDTSQLAVGASEGTLQLAGRRPQHYALTVPKPMIAAINGGCAGVGLVQALVCDVRFVAREAKLSTSYARRGLPAEYGTSWLLTRLVGVERALDLLVSARTFDGVEAHAIGVASRLCDAADVLDAAQAYAQDLATNCSPRAMSAIRRQVWGDLSRPYDEANAGWLAAMQQFNNAANPDFAEGVASFVEKRAPHFEPLPVDWKLPPLPEFAPQD